MRRNWTFLKIPFDCRFIYGIEINLYTVNEDVLSCKSFIFISHQAFWEKGKNLRAFWFSRGWGGVGGHVNPLVHVLELFS